MDFFGRKTETEKLTRAFERVQKGQSCTVLVTGPPGVGKSALVHRFALRVESAGGMFVFGKADLNRSATPFGAVGPALDMIVKKRIAEAPEAAREMARMVARRMGGDLGRAVALLPSLSYLLPEEAEKPVPADRPRQSAPVLIYNLLEILTRPGRGLVLFLDDIQWLDGAALALLAHLCVAPPIPGLLLVLGFRGLAYTTAPKMAEIEKGLRETNGALTLALKGLGRREIAAWLKHRLRPCGNTAPLAALCHEKTLGNPLYLIRFVEDLVAGGDIHKAAQEWRWHEERIRSRPLSENVVDLIVSRIKSLSEASLAILKYGALMQGEMTPAELALCTGLFLEEIDSLFAAPLALDLVEKRVDEGGYGFTHDRVREAVCGITSPGEAAEIHYRLMSRHLAAVRERRTPGRLFPLLHHFERCGAECACLTGAFDTADRLFREAEPHAPDPGARFGMEMVKIVSFQARDQHETVLAMGRRMLAHLGHPLPERIWGLKLAWQLLRVWWRCMTRKEGASPAPEKGGRPDDRVLKELLSLGPSTNYMNRKKLFALIVARGLEISLRWGDTGESPMFYLSFGIILNRITGSTAWGRRLAATAREIRARYPDEGHRAKEMLLAASYLDHWHSSMPRILSVYEEGMQLCRKQGDHVYYAYYAATRLYCRLLAGAALGAVLSEAEEILSVLRRMKNAFGIQVVSSLVRMLGGLAAGEHTPFDLKDAGENSAADMGHGRNLTMDRAYHLCCQICGAFFSGRTDPAHLLLPETSKLPEGYLIYNYIRFLAALIEIDAGKNRKRARKGLKAVRRYARENPDVYRGRCLLAEGEFARVWGRPSRALGLYRRAEAILATEADAFFESGYLKEKAALVSALLGDDGAAQRERARAIAVFRKWGLGRREGLFEGAEPDAGGSRSAGEGAGGVSQEAAALFSIAEKARAGEVHAVVREAACWKSMLFVSEGSLHRPPVFPQLPDRMLTFAAATGKVVTATAGDSEEQFFDTAYFFTRRPGALVVLPAGERAAVLIVNPGRDVEIDALKGLAEPVFDWLSGVIPEPGKAPVEEGGETKQLLECCRRLQAHMVKEKPYRDSKLGLKQLAGDLAMPARTITAALNIGMGQNVNTFINSYRIEAVKEEMARPENAGRTILEIALAAGFNSKSAFNNAFRKQTGMTPSAWREARGAVQACATAVKGA